MYILVKKINLVHLRFSGVDPVDKVLRHLGKVLLVGEHQYLGALFVQLLGQLVVERDHLLHFRRHRLHLVREHPHDRFVRGLHVLHLLGDRHHLSFQCLVSPDHVVQGVDGEHRIERVDVVELLRDPLDGVVARLLELFQLEFGADLSFRGLLRRVEAGPQLLDLQEGSNDLKAA